MGKCSKTPVLANRLLNVSLWSTEEAGQGSKEMMYQLLQMLGMCTSASLGGAVIFVMTIASAVASILYNNVLKPFGLDFMKTIVFILVIAALVQIVEMFLKKKSPAVYQALGTIRIALVATVTNSSGVPV